MLLFHLNEMYDKTYTSIEVKLALQKGYKIEIASCLEFYKYTGLMKEDVEFFLKPKIMNNKHYTEEECRHTNKTHKGINLDVRIRSEETQKNSGMKQLAKLA
jgi:stage III sporulation protein SpoIIIAA